MKPTSLAARQIADNASFQAFANCYLREVDAGSWQTAASWQAATGARLDNGETHVIKLELESEAQVLALGVRFRSRVGRHTLTAVFRRKLFHREWQRIDALSAQLILIDALYAQQPESEHRLELISRVIESRQTMAEYVQARLASSARTRAAQDSRGGFIESEQSVALGHWLHPTPKSRQGIHGWQHDHYTPELGGRFQLHFFAAERGLVRQCSLLDRSAEVLTKEIASQGHDAEKYRRLTTTLGDAYCLLPLHPLQAQWLSHQDYVLALIADGRLVDLGRLGAMFTPTSSVRTLYSESAELMIKLSIPVKITNSLRINLQTELGDSVWISQLLRTCGIAQAFPELHAIEDPAYITVALPDREETGFEVIFRSNPFRPAAQAPAQTVHSIAALTQDPLTSTGSSLLAELVVAVAGSQHVDLEQAARRWFDAYWKCAVEAPLRIYDRYGIALEAHQQNSLLELDASGLPRRCYYRDIQGLALSELFRDEHIARVPELAHQTKVFEPDEIVRSGLGYYLFFNQLYAVINRFALDGMLDEDALLDVVRQKLVELRPSLRMLGALLVDALLEKKTMPCKANLRTRLADMDELQSENELAVYTQIDNPLHVLHHEPAPARAPTGSSRHVS